MTNDQLRQNASAMIAFADGKPIQLRYTGEPRHEWTDAGNPVFELHTHEYRPKPEPVSRPWSKPEDVPGPICWMRKKNGWACMVVEVECNFVSIGGGGIAACKVTWDEMKYCEHSTDRKTWLPCTVAEEAK